MRKRILSALLAVLFLITGLPGTAWAVGEGNMEAGGGQTETVTGDSFWNGQWGIRFCVVDVASQTVVSATYDASNYGGLSNYWHYGKTNKFDYRNGATLTIRQGNYTLETPAVSIPTIVRTSGAPDIKAIKDYFTDETVIRWIGDVTGMAYDTLISGDYKLFIEPILYYTFDSQKYAMTATEAALFDRAINGLLLRTMGNATHQQLPLSLYLEKSDLGFSKWAGAKTGIQNDTNIINYLGMGIVSFIPEEEPEPGTGGNGDGPTVPISFRKTDPERFNAANYNTGLITFAPASSNSAAFDNISGAVIEISGDGTGAGTYELPCTVELGEGTFTVREVAPPYGYLLNDAWSAEITVEVEKDGEGKPVEGAEAEATITVSGGGGTDGTSYASVEDYRQRGQLTVTKVDNETISLNHGNYRTPQGDATFAGAVFELRAAKDIYLPSTWIKIYSEGDLVATAVTGNDGSFTINGIEQGVYTLQEITPSDGYVFQGAKARGQIYTITNAYTGSGTNILSFDDKAAGDTGNKNQYANTVIKADLTLTKFNENRTVENEMDGNAYEMNKQPAEGVYFAVYLNSKAAAGGNPIYSTTDDPVGDGTSGSASTAGWGYLDLVNHNFYSPLPDEWFKQRDLDANNPLPNGNPSVEEGRAEETDLARISMKDLYMVLRTDSTGMAQTSELELGHYTVKEVATTWGYLTDGEPIDVVLAYAGQAVTIYPKYLEVENIRQNVIFKVLKEAVTKNGNKPANDVYFGLYNAQSIYASADEAWIVMPCSNFIIKKGETVTLDIGLSSLIADEQVTVTVEKMANPDPAGKPIEVTNVKNHDNRVFELIGTEVGSTTFAVSAAGLSIEGTIEVLAEDAELPDPMPEAKPASSMQDGENTLTMTVARTNYRLIAGKRVDERTDKLDVTFSEDAAQEYSVHVKDKSVAVYDPDSRCFFGVAAGSTTFTVQNTDGLVVEGTIEVLVDPEAVTGDDLTGRSSGETSTEAAAPETEKEDGAVAHTSEDEQATENTDGSQAEEGSPAEPPAVPAELPAKLPAKPPAVPTDAEGDDPEPEPVIPAAEIPAAIPGTATKEKEAVLPKVLIPADSLLEVIRIKDGVGTSSLDLPLGSYYIRELKAPANYEYDPDQRWYFRFMYSPLAGTTVTVTANGGHVIVNKTDERPPVIIIPEEIGRMELHKPKGPNYSTTTNPGTGAGEPWEEAELIRERKTEDALINTYVFTSDREDDELQLAKKISDGDVTWRLRGIDYLLLRTIPSGKRIEETVSFDSLDNKSVPETYTVTVDGEEIILQLEKADYTEHRSEGTQGYWSWDPITVTGTLYGSPTMTKYYLGDELIPYNDSAPVIGGYETAYLQYLGLNADNFRIKSGAWSGEWTTGSDGQSLRNVTFRCSRLTWHEGNPAVTYYSAEAVYSNGLTDGPERYEIQATATYTPSRAAVVAAAVGGTGAIVVCAFLWIRLNNARFFDPDGRPIGRGRVKRTRTADTVLIGKAKYRLIEIEEDRLDEE